MPGINFQNFSKTSQIFQPKKNNFWLEGLLYYPFLKYVIFHFLFEHQILMKSKDYELAYLINITYI